MLFILTILLRFYISFHERRFIRVELLYLKQWLDQITINFSYLGQIKNDGISIDPTQT